MDIVKGMKYDELESINNRYKKFMCSQCDFYKDNTCEMKRIPRVCAKKGLKNRSY